MAKTNKKEVKKTITRIRAREYREKAADIVKPHRSNFALVYFTYAVLIGALSLIASSISFIDPVYVDPNTQEVSGTGVGMMISSSLIVAFTIFTSSALIFSFIHMAKEANHNHRPTVNDIFYGFKHYGQALGVYVAKSVFVLLWSLLLIIPGIIKSFAYALSEYIAFDHPEKSPLDCITESQKLMQGNKWKLFCLQFSYIGWFLLTILTIGILSFWVMPRYHQAIYRFYLHTAKKD